MWRLIALGIALLAVVIFGFSLIDSGGGDSVSASVVMTAPDNDLSAFTRAVGPWAWQFPRDHGPHPEFQTEWWYYTGNLSDDRGRRFGYQFTIFRRAITPVVYTSSSEWRVDQIYMAHFTVTDVAGDTFHHDQRFSRGAAGLAGATADPRYRVWVEDWQVIAQNDDPTLNNINASAGDVSIDLQLKQVKPPSLQGDAGLSAKSDEPGNASYYYSLTRLITEGTITIRGQSFTVNGATWMDHEFSTSALGDDALGWDWFGLQLDDNRELMLGQIRLADGGTAPVLSGLLVYPDGSTYPLNAGDFTITPTGTWTSPHTNAVYPAGWEISIAINDQPNLEITLTPLISDQELHGGGIAYWEGAVRISGGASGYGYAELTGYVDAMTGRF